jgi:hypothetical protein
MKICRVKRNEAKEMLEKLTNVMAVSHALMYSAMFATGDKFLEEPRALITDMLTLRLRPLRFQSVTTRFVHHAAHYGFLCNV